MGELRESNPRPLEPQSNALPTELRSPKVIQVHEKMHLILACKAYDEPMVYHNLGYLVQLNVTSNLRIDSDFVCYREIVYI